MALTQVPVMLDQIDLQTLKMGLSALQMQAVAVQASIDTQVQNALDAAAQREAQNQEDAAPPKGNGKDKRSTVYPNQ